MLVLGIVDSHMSGAMTMEEIKAKAENNGHTRPNVPKLDGAVGVLPLQGPIFPKANLMTELSGATSLEQWRSDFRALVANDRVSQILLDIDSPGGISSLVQETAMEIRAANQIKPVVAVSNTMAASAAYMLASQAGELYVSDSGFVGSVGVYLVHTDTSELEQRAGVKNTIIKAGRFKAALIEPLTAENREHLQESVLQVYDDFVEQVALGRGTDVHDVMQNYGEGGVVSAKKAMDTKMVDGIATFDEVLKSMLDGSNGTTVSVGNNGGSDTGLGLRASLDRELEHSEPGSGTGGEPQPRIPPEDEDIDEWERGERLHRPPNLPELEESVMTREQLLAYAGRLNISNAEELDDEALTAAVTTSLDNVIETASDLEVATAQATQQQEFAQLFPDQAEELRKLKARSQESDAVEFANSLADFKVTEGEQETNFRLSVVAQETVKDTHIKLAQGHLVHDDLKALIESVATGAVEQGERGSSRISETDRPTPTGNRYEDRKAFATRVSELMENDNMDRKAAIAEAGRRYPELAAAYVGS